MKKITLRGRRNTALTLVLALVGLVLPLASPAFADSSPTLDVEPELQYVNVGDLVTLTATISGPTDHEVNIDWENEGGPNDPDDDSDARTPDRECDIAPGAVSCVVTYTASNPGYFRTMDDPNTAVGSGGDRWRVWVDQDHAVDEDLSDLTSNADGSETRDHTATAGTQPQSMVPGAEPCESTAEPDCTDVVEVNVGELEVVPDVQTVDAGSTAILTARMFGPVRQATGINIDFENEGGSNDTDSGTSRRTPDRTCDIAQGARECTINYAVLGGSDQWRAWIDADKVQSTVEADTTEGRYAGPRDCEQPEDGDECPDAIIIDGDADDPGDGCGFTGPEGSGDPTEPDCTDVVSVSSRAGTVGRIDCDDRSGTQGQDTERETNPESNPDPVSGADPATEPYLCEAFNTAGGRMNGVVIYAENENGVNDPDSPDSASHTSPDYTCTTAADPRNPNILLRTAGRCYIDVEQEEGELGTAEICFWAGTPNDGAALCADEPTGENQVANGTDTANDLADQVEKTWADTSTLNIDCSPETATNPAGATHTVTCTASADDGATVTGVRVNAEIEGTGDAPTDNGNTPETPDRTCTTGTNGQCSYTHTSSSTGNTTYRSWIEDNDNPPFSREPDLDEGRDEVTQPGSSAEPDYTDVTAKTWTPGPATVVMTPESDTAPVGQCNPYTITVTDADGNPVPNAIMDVEQRHELSGNQAQNDEPTVGFCTPPASGGPNPSDVDETKGDLGGGTGSGQESPNNPGTAGGETSTGTDQNGKVTIGITVSPGNGSNGSGNVAIRAWWESTDNDDPDSAEPQDTASKTWTPSGGPPGQPAGLSLQPSGSSDEPGEQVTYTATVSDGNGDPVEGATVAWTEEGAGEFVSEETTTDADGRATAVVTSNELGTQTITATADDCVEGSTCSDSSTQVWAEDTEEESCPGHANDSRNQVVGTPGNDVLRGTDGDDVICGLGGKDTLIGRGGNDLLLGGGANDILRGNAGNDRLKGGGGEDTLAGGAGRDTAIGAGGDDILRGGGGNDTLRGGKDKDVLRGRGGKDRLFGQKGRDSLNGGSGNDRLDGGPGQDVCVSGGGRDRFISCE